MAPTSKKLTSIVGAAIDVLFERLRGRLLGYTPKKTGVGKGLVFGFTPELTLRGLFEAASKEEGVKTPNEDLLNGLLGITSSYLDAHKEKAKAQVVQAVQSFVQDNQKAPVDVEEVLTDKLSEIMEKVSVDVTKVVETETTIVRNSGLDDAIQRMSAMVGIEDPTVFFAVVRDGKRCEECTRLHLQPDRVTPRVWKRSDIGAGYHKKGDSNPKVGGLHPHCRCQLTVLMPGFGFDASGKVIWKERGWDEYARQK